MVDTPISTKELRRSLGSFVTGVTVLTTKGPDGEPVGLTVNSFNAVSLEPPLILWSLSLHAASFQTFVRAAHFAVNILAADQQQLSELFARTGGDKFSGVAWREGAAGMPLLDDTAANLVCRNSFRHQGGDHLIFVGEVIAHASSDRPPLVYANGRYAEIVRRDDEALEAADLITPKQGRARPK
jgi:3-hydroxy-9,10-secoandrosta-1,3,5(10)-triene-9,17-dione monooxygenase reductase component